MKDKAHKALEVSGKALDAFTGILGMQERFVGLLMLVALSGLLFGGWWASTIGGGFLVLIALRKVITGA